MSARAKTMLQMALKLSGQEKESNVQPTDSPDTDQQSITEVQQEIENPVNINVYTNFPPIIQNESIITIVEGRSDSDINDLLNSFPEPQECFETENEQFDDSDVDPNYVPSESDESNILTSDSEIELMAAEIENNLQNDTQAKLKEKYLRKIKQNKRNHGKPYDTKSGKKVSERRCTPLEKCRKLCQTKISFEQQKAIFDQYWNLGSYKQRILFISGLLRVEDKKTQKMNKSTTTPRNRNHSVYYYLEIGTQLIHICQRCFRCCFGETDSFLKSVVKKKLNLTLTDHRGIATPSNKVSDDKINAVKVHIESFPAYESHYTRRDTSQKYFHADLTLGKIYQLYCEKQSDPISLSKFSNIFKGKH